MVRIGITLKITNLIRKGEGWWCVSSSSISYAKPVSTNVDTSKLVLPEQEPVAGCKRSIKDALGSQQKSTVVAKVLKVSPLKFRREGSLAVRSLGIKDESGTTVKVSLFDKLATQDYLPDSVVQFTSLYNKVYNNRQQLTATKDTELQFVANHNLQTVTCTLSDDRVFNEDPDFSGYNEDCTAEDVYVTSIFDVALYDACTNSGCRKKKVQNAKCPSCNGMSSEKSIRLKIEIGKEEEQEEGKTFTIFQRDAEVIFELQLRDDITEDEVIENLVVQLPIAITCKMIRNNLVDIQKKK